MIRAGQAIRLGLRAATRNPELSFGKSLLDLMGTVLGLLPVLFIGFVLWRAFAGLPVLSALLHVATVASRIGWPIAGAIFTASAISWALGAGFLAGALPSLAADVEMGERTPPGTFLRLASAGFARVSGASAIGTLLFFLVGTTILLAILFGVPLFLLSPSPALAAAMAAIFTCSIGTGFLVDLLANLSLVRAAVLGDGPATAFVRGAKLMGERLGAAIGIALVFLLIELMLATAIGAFAGPLFISDPADVTAQLFALGPRIAITIVSTVVLAWVDLSQKAALAALAADAEGLLVLPPEAPPPEPQRTAQRRRTVQTWELRPPKIAVQPETPEQVIEALPVEEKIIEALPVEEKVIDALPVEEEVSDTRAADEKLGAPSDPTGTAASEKKDPGA